MKIIGLMGAAGSGKSTAAKYLAEKFQGKRYSLADPLKEIAMRTFGFSREQCYGTQAQKETVDPRYGFSPRWLLQRLGTEGCRAVLGESVWTDALLRRIAFEKPALAIVEDVRFINEAVAIRAAGGVVWRLAVQGQSHSNDDGSHASEREWMDAPFDDLILAAITPGSADLLDAIDACVQSAQIRAAAESDGWVTAYPPGVGM